MADFYDMVTPPEQRRRREKEKITVYAVIALLLVFASGFVILRLAGYKTRVREFHYQLNDSTIYAYEHDCLRADFPDGQSVRITGEHNYNVYQFLSCRSLGRNALFTPKGDAVTLDYGDGAVLRLWADRDARGLYVRFDAPDGSRCLFHSRDMRLNDLTWRYLSLSKNAPWEA